MTREQLGGLKASSIPIGTIDKKDIETLLSSADRVLKEPAFLFVINSLVDNQTQFIAKHADVDNPLQNYMGRFTINGICLVMEEFERLSGEFENLKQPKDLINSQDIL